MHLQQAILKAVLFNQEVIEALLGLFDKLHKLMELYGNASGCETTAALGLDLGFGPFA